MAPPACAVGAEVVDGPGAAGHGLTMESIFPKMDEMREGSPTKSGLATALEPEDEISPTIPAVVSPRQDRVVRSPEPAGGDEEAKQCDSASQAACAICLERCSWDAECATVPCLCQERLDAPTMMHMTCLSSWVSACARRATNGPEPRGPTCPLCRASFSDDTVLRLMIAPRPRVELATRARDFAQEPLLESDGTLRCVVRVLDHSDRRRWPKLFKATSSPLLALSVEGLAGHRSHSEAPPLLVARAPQWLMPSRLATKFELVSLAAHPLSVAVDDAQIEGTVVGRITRNWNGTRWTVHSNASTRPQANGSRRRPRSSGDSRCLVEYSVNRLANRPRSMYVNLGGGGGGGGGDTTGVVEIPRFMSRTPEYNAQLQGFCLDFFGRARLASVRNFQIVDMSADAHGLSDEQRCLLLFGRWSPKEFHLDVKAPFSLIDAFAIAVSSYATKIATI